MASEAADRTIDELLERYLGLLDQHATLRASLAAAQQDTLHSLARANFSAPRGARYGPDQYDARMQASRRVVIAVEDKSAPPTFTVTEEDNDAVVGSTREGRGGEEGAGKDAAAARDDPIRWFGVLVPQALRDAQSHARRAVQDVIPRLASVQAEMAHVEIEVRRARKRRAKASGGGGQKQDVVGSTAQTVSASS
ncbi:Coiled-coil domain-containing protein 115 [Beauveria bassiana]|uniref:Vacuolar ATPase assembly protein VMA22 n=1 Tax=Beauveria bassiana (strain ARSEF 2860) TaxID=655819 RepID=J4USY5_BEAB2|nr:uncharacterized protein BBA_01872 [Beauveria bassiana ARSEF 2860]EJP68837.1 hypothetical protein BBA_01872 [Beauveria bassiana ARSEF 2860]KAH8720399.1 Coiled-coil domain-containing protein 115 [Beauveria bassiana]